MLAGLLCIVSLLLPALGVLPGTTDSEKPVTEAIAGLLGSFWDNPLDSAFKTIETASRVLPASPKTLTTEDAEGLKQLLVESMMFLTEGEYVEEATRVSKMFDLLHEHHPQAVSYVESLAEKDELLKLASSKLGAKVQRGNKTWLVAEPISRLAYTFYQEGGYDDFVAGTAGLLYVLFWHHMGREDRDALFFKDELESKHTEDSTWLLQALVRDSEVSDQGILEDLGWYEESAGMSALVIRLLLHYGYYVDEPFFNAVKQKCRRASSPSTVVECYVAWKRAEWEFGHYYYKEPAALETEDVTHLCAASESVVIGPAGKAWCSVVRGDLAEDNPAVLQDLLRGVASDKDCHLVAYLWDRHAWVDIQALRWCAASEAFEYYVSSFVAEYPAMKSAFQLMLHFVGAPEWEDLSYLDEAPMDRYQANHVVYEEEVGDIGADVIDAIEFLRWLGDSNNVGLADGLMRALAEFGQRSPYPHCRMDWCTAPGMEHLMLSSTT